MPTLVAPLLPLTGLLATEQAAGVKMFGVAVAVTVTVVSKGLLSLLAFWIGVISSSSSSDKLSDAENIYTFTAKSYYT